MAKPFGQLQVGERFYFSSIWRRLNGTRQRWVKATRTEAQQDLALRRAGASITVHPRRTVWPVT